MHDLLPRWPDLDIAAKRTRLINTLRVRPGHLGGVAGQVAATCRVTADDGPAEAGS